MLHRKPRTQKGRFRTRHYRPRAQKRPSPPPPRTAAVRVDVLEQLAKLLRQCSRDTAAAARMFRPYLPEKLPSPGAVRRIRVWEQLATVAGELSGAADVITKTYL